MANASEVLDLLTDFRKETNRNFRDSDSKNEKAHEGIKTRLDTMNGQQRENTSKIQALESTQVTHEGKLGIADHERASIWKRLNEMGTSKKVLVAIVSGAVTVTLAALKLIESLLGG